MTTAYTSLLGLALPVQGELSGTWGDTVNNAITSLLDTAVAGTTTLSTDADVTLTTTTGASNQARQAILLCSGARTALRTITAPAQSKLYVVNNATTGGFGVKVVGVGPTTGVTVVAGETAVVAWNGSDFVKIAGQNGAYSFTGIPSAGPIGSTTPSTGAFTTLTSTGNTTLGDTSTDTVTINGTATYTPGTANGVAYLNGSKVLTSGSALTFDGTNLGMGVTPSAWSGYKAIQINAPYAALFASNASSGSTMGLSSNTYYDGANWKYINSQTATYYSQTSGQHQWHTAPSGTAGNAITFTQAMTLDASGNLGLGVVPSAWNSNFRALQVGQRGSLWSSTGSSSTHLSNNVLYDAGGFKYLQNGMALSYEQGGGAHYWYTAPSGTAGNPITFTQAMTLNATGSLLIGQAVETPNPLQGFCFYGGNAGAGLFGVGHTTGTASGIAYGVFNYNGSAIGSITQNGTTAVAFNTTSDHRLKNNVRPANARRFKDIQFRDFEWVDGRHDCGLIAHELQEIYPDLVVGEKDGTEVRTVELSPAVPAVTERRIVKEAVLNDDGTEELEPAQFEEVEISPAIPAVTEDQTFAKYQQVNYIGLIPRMGTVVQQLMAQVEAQQALIDAQAAAIAALTARLDALEGNAA